MLKFCLISATRSLSTFFPFNVKLTSKCTISGRLPIFDAVFVYDVCLDTVIVTTIIVVYA